MNNTTAIFAGLMIGAISAIYLPMNSSVSRHLGSPLTATITFYSVALITSIAIFGALGEPKTLHNLGKVPVYLYLTGFISAFIVLAITFLIPILGARKLTVLAVAGQLILAVLISHFGMLESPKDPVTIKKLAGAGLLIFGAVLSVS